MSIGANILKITPSMRERLDMFFASTGAGFNAYALRRKRMGELARLDALSDGELNEIGLTRDRIPEHVFRDVLGTV